MIKIDKHRDKQHLIMLFFTRLTNAIKNSIRSAFNKIRSIFFPQKPSFSNLPIPWTIAQLEDEEDPRVV
ncbi:MAG TPA: hypothetical protein DCY88_14810 [Cyanobacteria bacterium UBA11372]|nr:hypothetical protein [Cyanobacteria bacterium UBA11372]